jgi:hypothetical protein
MFTAEHTCEDLAHRKVRVHSWAGFVSQSSELFVVASGALRSALRAEEPGKNRFELLCDQPDRLRLLHEERRVFTEELERER